MFSLASDSGHILLDFQRSVLDKELRILCNRFFLFMFQFLPHQTHCITSDIITLQINSNKCNFEMVNCLRLFSILGQNTYSQGHGAAGHLLPKSILSIWGPHRTHSLEASFLRKITPIRFIPFSYILVLYDCQISF